MLLAIDPGPTESAFVFLCDDRSISLSGIYSNDEVLWMVDDAKAANDPLAIESVECYGMPVGAEVFQTCYWIGRFIERRGGSEFVTLVPRREVKLHLCGNVRAKDPNIRQAILDLYGGSAAVGKKKSPGPLYGITSHLWSALAVGLTFRGVQR